MANLLPFTELLGGFGLLLAEQLQLLHLPPQLDVGRFQSRVSGNVQFGASLQTLRSQSNRGTKRGKKKEKKLEMGENKNSRVSTRLTGT